MVAYDREGLHSFFVKDKAVVAIFVSQVVRWYHTDVIVGQARWMVVKVRGVDVHPFV